MQAEQAILVFLLRDDEVLLAESGYRPGKITWNGISGGIEGAEKPEDAATRELYEEIKVRVYEHDLEKVGMMHLYTLSSDQTRKETLSLTIFTCVKWQGKVSGTPGIRPQWFTIAQIPYTDMFEDTDAWLPKVLAGEKVLVEVLSKPNPLTQQNEVKDVIVRGILS